MTVYTISHGDAICISLNTDDVEHVLIFIGYVFPLFKKMDILTFLSIFYLVTCSFKPTEIYNKLPYKENIQIYVSIIDILSSSFSWDSLNLY